MNEMLSLVQELDIPAYMYKGAKEKYENLGKYLIEYGLDTSTKANIMSTVYAAQSAVNMTKTLFNTTAKAVV